MQSPPGVAVVQQITKEKLVGWQNEVRERGMESGRLSAAGTAIKEISILTGHRVERSEVGAPGEYDALALAETMSLSECWSSALRVLALRTC
jgi:hypothetical protein